MKKAALYVYILMVAGCLACLQSAANFMGDALTPCAAAVTILKPAGGKHTMWVRATGTGKIYWRYAIKISGAYTVPVNTGVIYCSALNGVKANGQ